MDEELKACPFCGGPMTLKVSRSNGHQIFGSHTKECAFSDISACMQEPSDCEWVADEIIKRWNTRAQLPSQGGEAVEVVATLQERENGRKRVLIPGHFYDQDAAWAFRVEPLMTVAQHQRILAAATHPADQVADGVVVSLDLLKRLQISSDCYDPKQSAAVEELRALLAKSEGGKK